MFHLTWRLQRNGLIGMTAFGVFYGLIQAAAYNSIAGNTAASRLAFGQQMEAIGRQFSLFLPLPHDVGTIEGFIQWRGQGDRPNPFRLRWAVAGGGGRPPAGG